MLNEYIHNDKVVPGSMYVPLIKKHEFWNHFVAELFINNEPRYGASGKRVTGAKLRKIRDRCFRDEHFWQDVVIRHGGLDVKPEMLAHAGPETYQHCKGNFWGMLVHMMAEDGIV